MKKLLSLALALAMSLTLTLPVLATETTPETDAAESPAAKLGKAESAAWDLYYLGLFQGTGTDADGFPIFDLAKAPTRAEGVTMLVRLLGQEAAAKAGTWTTPFTDVPAWAAPYIGYAYSAGLTNGTGDTTFSPEAPITATEYLTLVLRSLGYVSGTDFAWDSAWTLSDRLRITDGSYNADTNTDFLRADVALISLSALDAKDKTTGQVLRDKLAALGFDGGDHFRCEIAESPIQIMPNEMVFLFEPTEESPETYTEFQIRSVTINGVPCTIQQYTTPAQVKALCQEMNKAHGYKLSFPDAIALANLTYDEAKATAAATETTTMGGQEYPVLTLKFSCTGTLKDGTKVQELAVRNYYINGYGGLYGDIF